jgi:hypothetical protein
LDLTVSIQPNELRIGNYVYAEGSIIQLNVKSFEYAVCKWRCKDLKPIPITPEIIEKCGFVLKGHNWEFGRFEWNSYGVYWNVWDGIDFDHIKYLHQLQNLYHSITVEELIISI